DFTDTSYLDFLQSAGIIGPILAAAPEHSVGSTICEGVRLTRHLVPSNTNLGILLLLAPLAKVAAEPNPRVAVMPLLDTLDVVEAELFYDAIRLANPAGLGRVAEQDLSAEPTLPVRQIMALAADRDLVARQYANGFQEVFQEGVPALDRGLTETGSLEGA